MSDWKKYMEQSDAYAASLCKKSHKVYDVDPYVMVFEDEDVPGIFISIMMHTARAQVRGCT